MDDTTESKRETGTGRSGILYSVDWRPVLRDVLLVTVWVALLSVGWGVLRWPAWAYYVVVFGGILAYSVTADPWTESAGDEA